MYYLVVLTFMLVLPVASIIIEPMVTHVPPDLWHLLGRWFVFWAVGVRLLLAGLRQVAQPAFTASTIFGTSDPGALKIVPELGFGNIAAGVVAVLSLGFPAFVLPIAIYAALFYGLATLLHLRNGHRNRLETVALVSDGGIALLLAAYVAAVALRLTAG